MQNQRDFLLELTKELSIPKLEDWYSLKPQKIIDAGGRGLLDFYKGSIFNCLTTLYPGTFHFTFFIIRAKLEAL